MSDTMVFWDRNNFVAVVVLFRVVTVLIMKKQGLKHLTQVDCPALSAVQCSPLDMGPACVTG